jgi:Sigma-70 region 3
VRDELEALLSDLVRKGADIDIDDFAILVRPLDATSEELDELMSALEEKGISVRAPEGGQGEKNLAIVLRAARDLQASLGRTPTASEIAEHTNIDVVLVRQALALGRIMGR